MENIAKLKETAMMAAMAAGEELKTGFYKEKQIQEKTGHHDLVTEYDKRSEEIILRILTKEFPQHGFVTEETGVIGKVDSPIVWCIDPLDGTWNFAHNIPIFSITMAALQQWQPIVAVTYNPLLSELFVAEKGKGAFLNGGPLTVSDTKLLERAGLSYSPWACNPLRDLTKKHVMMRRSGSAALDLAYVAAGRLDGFFEGALQNWDFAAGALLVEEAGGVITNLEGERLNFRKGQSILGGNKQIYKELLSFFHEHH